MTDSYQLPPFLLSTDPAVLAVVAANSAAEAVFIDRCCQFADKYGARDWKHFRVPAEKRLAGLGPEMPTVGRWERDGDAWVPRAGHPARREMDDLVFMPVPTPGLPQVVTVPTGAGDIVPLYPKPFLDAGVVWVVLPQPCVVTELPGDQWKVPTAGETLYMVARLVAGDLALAG